MELFEIAYRLVAICLVVYILFFFDFRKEPKKSDATKASKDDKLNDREFYELMQAYRHAELSNQANLKNHFENVKKWIRNNYR